MTNYGREHLAFLARRAAFLDSRVAARTTLGAQASLDAAERDAIQWAVAEAKHLDAIAAAIEDQSATPHQRLAAAHGLLRARLEAHSAAISKEDASPACAVAGRAAEASQA